VKLLSIALLAASFTLGGCSKEDRGEASCNKQINSLVNNSGAAEEINRYDSGDYHSHTYWYWSRGFSRTFTWGENVVNCEISDYTFSPI
jgi:hypothetical protein